jgi:hypothetical protein
VFKRNKTGPLAFNVEYTLQVLRCKQRSLGDNERKLADTAVSIDEKYPRPTSDEVKALIEKLQKGQEEEQENQTDSEREAVKDLA